MTTTSIQQPPPPEGEAEFDRFGPAVWAQRHPDRIAALDNKGRTLTYAEFDSQVNRLIDGLATLGVEPGGVFAILSENRVEILVAHNAAYRGGFFFCPLNPRLKAEEITYILRDSGAAVLLVAGGFTEILQRVELPGSTTLVWLDDVGGDAHLFGDLLANSSERQVGHKFGSVLSYTSGTTGLPKGVLRRLSRPSSSQAEAIMRFGLRVGYDPDHDRHLVTAPLSHGGPTVSVQHSLNMGGTAVIMGSFDPIDVMAHVEKHQITSTYMVPTMYHRLLRLDPQVRDSHDMSSLRSIVHTGAPCPAALKARMLEWLGPVVYECYAATEGLGTYTVCTPEDAQQHPGTVGRPEPGLITVRDEDGDLVAPGEVGRIYAQTLPGVAPFEYKGDPDKTRRAYAPDGSYHVGDLGYMDEDGYLFLTGRSTDMIISGGVNVYPVEVEGVLLKHPLVVDVAVLGLADDEWGERVIAVVQLPGTIPTGEEAQRLSQELISFAKESLASYKCPKEVHFLADLGRDPSGKLRKHRLREVLP